MITQKKKREIVEELTPKFRDANGFYLIDFTAMTVEDAIRLRKAFREKNVEYRVAKNTLFLRAIEAAGGLEFPDGTFKGQTAVAFTYDDPISASKVLEEQIKEFKKPIFKGAMIDGEFFDDSKLEAITKLPTKEDIIAGIVGSLASPTSGIVRAIEDPAKGLVGAIGGVIRDLAMVIEEVAKKKAA
jgi:large subunit ribosomal protein L10